MKFYHSHGEYKLELNEYIYMYWCQLNFAMFYVTSALGISWQHLNHPNWLLCSVYRFCVYFHLRIILHHLGILCNTKIVLPRVKNCVKSANHSVFDDYGVNADETWMHEDWFYTTRHGIFCDGRKTPEESPPDIITRWIISQSKGFKRKGIKKISRFVRANVYLVLTSQVQARLSIVGNSESAVDAQQIFKSTFKALINEDYSISADIDKCQGVLEHALSKVDFQWEEIFICFQVI